MDPADSKVVDIDDDERFGRHSQSHREARCNMVGKKSPKFLASIGAHEFLSIETWKAALTELTASATLMFTLISTIIACLDSHEVDPKLLVPFAVFVIIFLFLIMLVPLSGGLISPVFTFIATLKGVVTLSRALIYVIAQCIGSIIGFYMLKCVMDPKLVHAYALGGCSVGDEGDTTSGSSLKQHADVLLVEFACTFVVLFVGLTVAFDKKRCKELGLPMVCMVVAGSVALAVFVSITVTGRAGYAGVGINPARCLGPALLHGGSLWSGHWVFWVGPFLACIIYYGVSVNMPKEGFDWVEGEYDVLTLTLGSWRTFSKSAV